MREISESVSLRFNPRFGLRCGFSFRKLWGYFALFSERHEE